MTFTFISDTHHQRPISLFSGKELYMSTSADIQNDIVMKSTEVGKPRDISQPVSGYQATSQIVTSQHRTNQQRP